MKFTQAFSLGLAAFAATSAATSAASVVDDSELVASATFTPYADNGMIQHVPAEKIGDMDFVLQEVVHLLDIVITNTEEVAIAAGRDPEAIFNNTGISVAKRSAKRSMIDQEEIMKRGFFGVVGGLIKGVIGVVNTIGEATGINIVDTILGVLGL